MTEPSETLDLKGLKCPLPALLARRRLARAAPGESITVISDDPMAAVDLPHMCHAEGYEVIAQERVGDVAYFTLRRPL